MDGRERDRRPMNTTPSDNLSEGMLCPKCKITDTIEHNDGQWCPRCGSFAIPPTQRTFRLSGPRAQGPSSACEQQQERALLAHSVHVVGDLVTLAMAFMMTVSGFVEGVSRAFLREQTISELFSKQGDAYNGM
jgi:hypothetical protein